MKSAPALAAAFLLAAALAAAAAPSRPKGIGIDERLAQDPVLAPALRASKAGGAAALPVFVRLLLSRAEAASGEGVARLDARLALYARLGTPLVVVLADPPVDAPEVDAWRGALRSLVERCRGRVLGYQVGESLETMAGPEPAAYAYLLKFVAVQARSIDPGVLVIQVAVGADDLDWQAALYREDVAAYEDAVPLAAPSPGSPAAAARPAADALEALVAREDPTAAVGTVGFELAAGSVEPLLAWHLLQLGGRASFTTARGGTPAVSDLLAAAAALKDVMGGEIVALDEAASSLRLTLDGRDIGAALPHRLLYNMTTFASYLVCWPDAALAGRLEVRLHLANAGSPAARSLSGGAARPLEDRARDEADKSSLVRIDVAAGRPLLIDFDYGAGDVYALRTEAAERALPTVDEVIFRHQQAEVAQQALYTNYTASALVSLHFRPMATDSGYDVVMENRFFWNEDAAEWEEHGFILNGTRWGANRPPFPMLQPEKVLSLPLSLRLNRDYVYHLEGVDHVAGRRCFLVRFDPVSRERALYRGKVWIDAERYVRLKTQAVQTGLTPPVVSNEEIQTFEPVPAAGGRQVYLFSRLASKQILLLAGRNVLVEKQVAFSDFTLDNPAFEEERRRARAGDNVMYRDTNEGLRYLVKRGNERVVSDRPTTTAKAFLLGASIDPSYDYPVPMGGLDYLDFDFLDKDLQFALIFAGVFAMGNVQKAQIAGSRFDINVDFFGIALSGNDQVYDEAGERLGERLRSRSASIGANLGYQLTDFQKLTFSTHVNVDGYSSAPGQTAAGFVVPRSGATVTTTLAYEYRRAGYTLAARSAWAARPGWRRWGLPEQPFDPTARTYTKYSVSAGKDVFLGPFSKLHVKGALYGGQRQDRFSMYRFGLFDETRMRGVPSAGVRFAEMLMQRAQYSFNLLDLYRLDLFYDHAWGRTTEAAAWTSTTGVGTEVSLRGPRSTLLKVGVGKGYLPRAYRGSGSWVVEFTILKPL